MEDMELWTAYTSQIAALVTVAAATLGLLCRRNLLRKDDLNAVFCFADRHLPDAARPVGFNLLTHMRMMAEVAATQDKPDRPER